MFNWIDVVFKNSQPLIIKSKKITDMHNRTSEQESALATFKGNIHLPGGGFHTLIIDLCKEFQLPFQTVRKVLKESQKSIEKSICSDSYKAETTPISKEHWLDIIKDKLVQLAKENIPVRDSLSNNEHYKKVIGLIDEQSKTKEQYLQAIDDLEYVYEMVVYKPLAAMLHTSILYWKLKNNLDEMNKEQRLLFGDYPQYMDAIEHLMEIKNKLESQC